MVRPGLELGISRFQVRRSNHTAMVPPRKQQIQPIFDTWSGTYFTLVTRRPYCPGRPKELCFTTLSLAMETMGMRLSFFGSPGQYGRLVTRANDEKQVLWLRDKFLSFVT